MSQDPTNSNILHLYWRPWSWLFFFSYRSGSTHHRYLRASSLQLRRHFSWIIWQLGWAKCIWVKLLGVFARNNTSICCFICFGSQSYACSSSFPQLILSAFLLVIILSFFRAIFCPFISVTLPTSSSSRFIQEFFAVIWVLLPFSSNAIRIIPLSSFPFPTSAASQQVPSSDRANSARSPNW